MATGKTPTPLFNIPPPLHEAQLRMARAERENVFGGRSKLNETIHKYIADVDLTTSRLKMTMRAGRPNWLSFAGQNP